MNDRLQLNDRLAVNYFDEIDRSKEKQICLELDPNLYHSDFIELNPESLLKIIRFAVDHGVIKKEDI